MYMKEFATLTKELNAAREQLIERDEEIQELKAERNNTRLLLEHLECLVSRHERSLRMTVVKRQAASQSGVSSEVEVLKALKSLFEHHKALDEKVRERLRVSLERAAQLEDELGQTRDELSQYKMGKVPGDGAESERINGEAEIVDNRESSKDTSSKSGNKGQHIGEEGAPTTPSKVGELQINLEKQTHELSAARERVRELQSRLQEMEETLQNSQKELLKAQEINSRLQRDLKENVAQKEDQEERIATLEKRYLNAQRESTSLHDLNEKLEEELKNKEAQFKLQEDKIQALQEKVELSEQKLNQYANLPDVEQELKERMEALHQVQEKHGSAEDRIQSLEAQLEEKSGELLRLNQRLKMNEEHNSRLSATVDKLLQESNERLQVHLKERMHSLEEKNALTAELERLRKILEDSTMEKTEILKELQRRQLEAEQLKQQVLQQEISFNIKQTEALTRSLSPGGAGASDFPISTSYDSRSLPRRTASGAPPIPPKRTPISLADETVQGNGAWDIGGSIVTGPPAPPHMTQAPPSSFPADAGDLSDGDADDAESIFSHMDVLSPSHHTDAQTLALMLQEQLDAINNEIRLIQEEKQSTEARAEELESRVGSVEHMMMRGRSLERPSPPISGRSTPKSHHSPQRDYLQKYHTGNLAAMGREEPPHSLGSSLRPEGSPPTPRSLRLGPPVPGPMLGGGGIPMDSLGPPPRGPPPGGSLGPHPLQGLATSSEDLRSSQDSLYKGGINQPKKKGIKSSIGRFFSKKDKQQVKVKEALQHHQQNYHGGPPGMMGLNSTNLYADGDIGSSDSLSMAGLGPKSEYDRRTKKSLPGYRHELLAEAMKAGTPFALWNGPTIVAWLELWVGMPAWYVAACRANVKSGAIMSALSDAEIQREIGISNPLHRLKLRLAIQEMVSLTSPSAPKTSRTTLAFGDMNHEWVGNEWLPALGLPQYRTTFMECLVDARMLDHLTKKDLRVQLKMVDSFHRTSLQFGITSLKKLNYDRIALEERRRASEEDNIDVIVWTNDRVIKWVTSIGLKEYANNLIESGVHGSLVALDESFDHNSLALALQIPNQNTQARQLLDQEFSNLLKGGTERSDGGGIGKTS
ncbi:Liprin-alpha-2 [Armadillidium nasatum]|uniref:Liprin-alpha-2 n=1 Tax=Armadillidium nasatum TaxID=96803 RepID=A0A5N5SVI0_9CRUS|nr:Liprin-alpha-2 [Armadillidium nasatum]